MWSRHSAHGFFLTLRPTSFDTRRVLVLRRFPRAMSERLLVLGIPTGLRLLGLLGWRGGRAAATSAAVARSSTVVLRHLRGGPSQRRSHLVRHDLPLGAPVPLLGLPAPLLEPAGHHHAGAPDEGLAHVLGHLPPADHVEEARRLLPLLGLPVLPTPVDGQPEGRGGLARVGEPQFRVPGHVSDQHDRVVRGHGYLLVCGRTGLSRPSSSKPPRGLPARWTSRPPGRVAG